MEKTLSDLNFESEYEIDADGTSWRMLPHSVLSESLLDVSQLLGDEGHGTPFGARIRVPQNEGRGVIEIIKVRDSLFVVRFNVEYHEDRRLLGDSHMAKVRILLSGQLRADHGQIQLDGAGAYLEVYPGEQNSHYTISGSRPTLLLVLNCTAEFFSSVANMAQETLPEPLASLIAKKSIAPQTSITPLGPDLLRAANDVMRTDAHYSLDLRKAYLSAKCQEIACSIVRELGLDGQGRAPQGLSVRDVNRIYEARDVLADNFQTPPTIAKLSRHIGINQTKLKAAFKAVFGITIADFTMKCRMERAGEMLATTDLNIAEIAYELGYNHPPNFTHAFRRFYGHTPKELRHARSLGDAAAPAN